VTQSDDLAAVLAAINAHYPTKKRAHSFGDPAVKSLTSGHILVLVSRRYVQPTRSSGEVPLPGGRVFTRYVGTSESDVDAFRTATTDALEGQILAGDIGPFSFESEDEMDDEVDGSTTWFTAADTWTY